MFAGGFTVYETSHLKWRYSRKWTVVKKFYGTRTNKPLSSKHTANQFVRWLLPEERATLFIALQEFQAEEGILELQKGNGIILLITRVDSYMICHHNNLIR